MRQKKNAQSTKGLLHEISLTINSALDLSEVLHHVVESSMKLVNAEAGALPLIVPEGETFLGNHTVNLPDALAYQPLTPKTTPLAWQAITEKRSVKIDNYPSTPNAIPWLIRHGVKASAFVPILAGEEALGILLLYRLRPRPFTERQIKLLEQVAQLASIAILNGRRYGAERQHVRELEAMQATFADILSKIELPALLESIAQRAGALTKAQSATIALYDPGRGSITTITGYVSASIKNQAAHQDLYLPVFEKVLQTRLPIVMEVDDEATPNQLHAMKTIIAIPLLNKNEEVGVLGVVQKHRQVQHNSSDIKVLMVLAQQATIAIQNAQLYQTALKDSERRTVLYQTSQQISSQLDVENICIAVHRAASQLMTCDAIVIALLHEVEKEIEDIYVTDENGRWEGRRHPLSEGLIGHSIRQRRSLCINDLQQESGKKFVPIVYGDPQNNTRSMLVALMRFGNKIIGAISTQSYQTFAYTEADLRTLELLATNAAIALENANLYADVVEDRQRLRSIYQASQDVGLWLDLEHIYVAIHKSAMRLMSSEAFAIGLISEDEQTVDFVYLSNKHGRWPNVQRPANSGLTGWHIQKGESGIVPDISALDKSVPYPFSSVQDEQELTASAVVALMRRGGKVTGVLSAQAYEKNVYTEHDLQALELIAANAAIAIENARLFAETRRLASTDDLTGVWNRRSLLEAARHEYEQLTKGELNSLATIMIDSDHFKKVNDTYGHLVGDQVLKELSLRYKQSLRPTDLLGRFGGEEFIIFLNNVGLEEAAATAERLRKRVADTPFNTTTGNLQVTISVGVALCQRNNLIRLDTLIDRADKALYQAKHNGRNCVEVWQETT